MGTHVCHPIEQRKSFVILGMHKKAPIDGGEKRFVGAERLPHVMVNGL
jgi:hypothetical protein